MNIVFISKASTAKVRDALETTLNVYAGKPVGVIIRTPANIKSVIDANPFPKAKASKAMVLFLDRKATQSDITDVTGEKNEDLVIGSKELYAHYSDGMGNSKLKMPAAKSGTTRNMNTVSKLLLMAENI